MRCAPEIVPPVGVEPTSHRVKAESLIQLSYRGMAQVFHPLNTVLRLPRRPPPILGTLALSVAAKFRLTYSALRG
jgi:hypothetical protein